MVSAISSTMSSTVDFARMQKQLLQKADSDGDSRLSLSEFEAAKPADAPAGGRSSSEIFSTLDADQDGYLTEQELVDGAEKMGPPPGPPPSTSQGLSEDSVKTLLELLAEELEKSAASATSDSDDTTAASSEETDETESASASAAAAADDEEEKTLALIQQFINEYRSAQASYLSAQNLVADTGISVSTVS